MKRLAAAAAALVPLLASAADMNAVNHAAQIASGVGAGTAVPSLGVGAVLQTLFGLVVVIAFVFGCAWLARKFGLQGSRRDGMVKIVGGASLGNKERVTVVEIGDTWLVLGAAPGRRALVAVPCTRFFSGRVFVIPAIYAPSPSTQQARKGSTSRRRRWSDLPGPRSMLRP